jgi:hypothetical protein
MFRADFSEFFRILLENGHEFGHSICAVANRLAGSCGTKRLTVFGHVTPYGQVFRFPYRQSKSSAARSKTHTRLLRLKHEIAGGAEFQENE